MLGLLAWGDGLIAGRAVPEDLCAIQDPIKLLNDDAGSGTGPLQDDFIHGTVMLPKSDAGLRWVLSPVLARHIATCCVFFIFLHEYEAITTPSQTPGRACSSGGEWPLPPEGTARAEAFCVYHDSVKLLGDNAVLLSLQVRVVRASVQDTSMCIF